MVMNNFQEPKTKKKRFKRDKLPQQQGMYQGQSKNTFAITFLLNIILSQFFLDTHFFFRHKPSNIIINLYYISFKSKNCLKFEKAKLRSRCKQ